MPGINRVEQIIADQHAAYLTLEEVAQTLSLEDGRPVSTLEVRQIEARAMRKLRAVLMRRKLTAVDLLQAE